MPALVADRATPRREVRVRRFPVLAGQKIFQGALVAINASGFARKGATATALKGVGVSLQFADNTAGAVWTFPAFAGRTGLAYPLGIDPTKVTVDHALGYPRFVVQQASSGPGGAPAALLVS